MGGQKEDFYDCILKMLSFVSFSWKWNAYSLPLRASPALDENTAAKKYITFFLTWESVGS